MEELEYRKVDLESLAYGGLSERFNEAMQDILLNIADPNTEATKKRSIILEVSLVPNDDRNMAGVEITVKTKPAPAKALGTTFRVGIDKNGGLANEVQSELPGQTYMGEDGEQHLNDGRKIIDLKRQKINQKGTDA